MDSLQKMIYSSRKDHLFIFLLYVVVILIITFLQQEFVIIPEMQSFDLVGDEARTQMLEKFNKWRWSFYIMPLFLMLIRLCLVSLCLFVGSFFFADTISKRFKDWWGVALIAQSVILLYSVVLTTINIAVGPDKASEIMKYSSLMFLVGENIDQWIKVPLVALNIFEVAYWFVMARLVSRITKSRFGKSFNFVMSSYGVGFLFYIVLFMFLILYLN